MERRFDTRVRALDQRHFPAPARTGARRHALRAGGGAHRDPRMAGLADDGSSWAALRLSYTTSGGAKAIAWSDFQQMLVMTARTCRRGRCRRCCCLPDHVSFDRRLASRGGGRTPERRHDDVRLERSLQPVERPDRRHVPRAGLLRHRSEPGRSATLAAESMRDSRRGLLFNAVAKIPMQFCILFIGVLVFVFYVFTAAAVALPAARSGAPRVARSCRADTRPLKERYDEAFSARQRAADRLLALRSREHIGATAEPPAEAFRERESRS